MWLKLQWYKSEALLDKSSDVLKQQEQLNYFVVAYIPLLFYTKEKDLRSWSSFSIDGETIYFWFSNLLLFGVGPRYGSQALEFLEGKPSLKKSIQREY